MRTTLTLDGDVAALLEKENRRAGEPMKQTVNRLLRSGLAAASKPAPSKPFVVKPLPPMGTPEQWDRWKDMSAQKILDELDGEFHR